MSNEEFAADIRKAPVTGGPDVDLSGPLAHHLHNLGYRKPRVVEDTHADDGPDSLRPMSVILSAGRPAIKGFDGTFTDYDGSTWDYWELETPITVLHEGEAA